MRVRTNCHVVLAIVGLISIDLFAQTQPSRNITMLLPDRKGAVRIDVTGLNVQGRTLRADGRQVKVTAESSDGILMSAFLEIAPKAGSSADVRDTWWPGLRKNTPFKLDDVQLKERETSATAEYTIREAKGVPVMQRNVHAYYGGDEVWAEVHLSKVSYKPGDDALFDSFLHRIEVPPTYQPNSVDNFLIGTTFYNNGDYARAARFYQRSLDAQQAAPLLNDQMWHVLVDNLGMAYGMSGDLPHAKQVFEAAIAKDPQYPLFEYNLACYYGEKNDLENAITHLKRAFELRANVLPGEKMPDPLQDDSFQRFRNNEQFITVAKSLSQ